MAAVDGGRPLTRSRIEAFDQAAALLSQSGSRWRGHAQQLQQAADVYVEQVNAPNGVEWSGQTAVSYFETAHADRLAVSPAFIHANAMADVAERGGEQLLGARETALEAIAEAEADDFRVEEDLSVTDNHRSQSAAERAARQAAAVGHRNYIAQHAALLQAENQRIATKLNAGTAQMAGMVPAHWRQPVTEFAQPVFRGTGAANPAEAATENREGTIQAVDKTWRREPPPPTPPTDPANMTEAQARAAWDAVNSDIASWNARCGRTFIVPTEQAAYDACVADRSELLERQAAIRDRLGDLGIPIEGREPAHLPEPDQVTEDTPPFPPPTQITGLTEHGAEQVNARDGHGVSESALQNAVTDPITPPKFKPDQYGGTYEYEGQDATVILNKNGQVVTAWAETHNGWRNP